MTNSTFLGSLSRLQSAPDEAFHEPFQSVGLPFKETDAYDRRLQTVLELQNGA
jgi:hypothetical protein